MRHRISIRGSVPPLVRVFVCVFVCAQITQLTHRVARTDLFLCTATRSVQMLEEGHLAEEVEINQEIEKQMISTPVPLPLPPYSR